MTKIEIMRKLRDNAMEHFHSTKPYTEADDAIRMELIKELEQYE